MHLPRKSPRTQRYLHSTFWSHGAGEINLPAWWIMLLRSPQEEAPHWTSRRLAAAQTILSYVADVGFLKFLYPSRTLAIVQKIVNRDRAWSDSRWGIRCAPNKLRTFSSISSDSTNATGNIKGITARAGSLLSSQVEGPASKPDLKYCSDRMQIDSRLAELFELPKNNSNYERAWHYYQSLQNLSEDLTPQQLENMTRYLITGPKPLSSERAMHLMEKIPFSERNERHHELVIEAELNRGDLDRAINYHGKSLRQSMYHGGVSLILRYIVEHAKWYNTLTTLNVYFHELCCYRNEKMTYQTIWSSIDRSSLWHHVRQMPCAILSRRAAEAAQLAVRPRSDIPDRFRQFVLELSAEAFSVQVDETLDIDAHRRLLQALKTLNKRFQTKTSSLYNKAISQLLPHKLENHEKLATEFYRKLKKAVWVPEPNVLHCLSEKFCAAKDPTGIFEVIDDFRRHHGAIPITWPLRVIPVLASYGEAESVHALFKEYVQRGGRLVAHLFDSLLHVHNRRAEPLQVARCFHDLQRDYGFIPKLSSWNVVISTYTRVGDVQGATTWFDRMVEAGCQPNARTYTFFMQMYAKKGDMEAVQDLFQQSEAAGFKPDLTMIDTLVLVLVKNDMLDEARKLVEEALQIESNQPREYMWNFVMDGYAHQGDLVRVKEIHKRMHELGVPVGQRSYCAIMRCLSLRRLPDRAHKILFSVLPRAGISTSPPQWTTVMEGFFERGDYQMVLTIYGKMLLEKIKPIGTTKIILLKSIAALERQQLDPAQNPKRELVRSMALFKEIVRDMNPAVLWTANQNPSARLNRLDEKFSSMNFTHLMFLYGREAAFDQVRELYEQYLATAMKFQGTVDFIPPIDLLSALLCANVEARDYEEAERCWHMSVEKAKKLAHRSDTTDGTPWRALYSHRFLLNLPLPLYMNGLEAQEKIDQITDTVESLEELGFEFHSNTWNLYVRILARTGHEKLAFSVCERKLMDQWYGWESLGHILGMRRRFDVIKPDGIRPTKYFPEYQTLVYLAAAYVKARINKIDAIQEMANEAPRTVNAVANMPQLDDDFQFSILGSAENDY